MLVVGNSSACLAVGMVVGWWVVGCRAAGNSVMVVYVVFGVVVDASRIVGVCCDEVVHDMVVAVMVVVVAQVLVGGQADNLGVGARASAVPDWVVALEKMTAEMAGGVVLGWVVYR